MSPPRESFDDAGRNPHEERARAVKAYKIAQVLRVADDVPAEQWREAGPEIRSRVADVAKVRFPSAATWEAAIGLLIEIRGSA